MGRLQVSRVVRARLGYFAGLLMLSAGVFAWVALGPALMVAGAGVMAGYVWLYDVDEPERPERSSQVPRRAGEL